MKKYLNIPTIPGGESIGSPLPDFFRQCVARKAKGKTNDTELESASDVERH
jgi:hypothetical protein